MIKPFPELGVMVKNIPVPRKGQKNPVDLRKIKRIYNQIAPLRGVVLEGALRVESRLTSVILHYLAGKQYKLHSKLREYIFDAEFCTFMQKRKMLTRMFEDDGDRITCLSKSEAKALRKSINDIVTTRDKFAHGDMIIDCTDFSTSIKYYSGGTCEEKIDPEDGKVFTKKCKVVTDDLRKIIDYLKTSKPLFLQPC